MNNILIKLVFVMLVSSPAEEKQANILINSIRDFGGRYSDCPVYVFVSDTFNAPCRSIKALNVTFIPLDVSDTLPDYPFLHKVMACARAEELLLGKSETMVWMDVDALVLKEPDEFCLDKKKKIAIRPVNLRNNVGLPVNSPADPYWQKIYDYTGLKTVKVPAVETLVDTQMVRIYLNCAVFSIRPDQGILREWKRLFLLLVDDRDFQSKACITWNHKIFLHQAVLSAVISSRIKENQIQWFSQKAGYPLHHHCQLPHEKRVANLNQLESLVYEKLWYVPNWVISVIRVDEPLRTWLQENYEKVTGKGVYAL
jgi:hypothetical protein